ncbi:uncharacterized protein MELLADRAFT_107662 [Melampsora larici-populina 98AG31]|uniref:Uncharacterized protein n=1 Tax=Melampsora larici-populina (strain 98AG31 / pathotype 3-4-7) TaxID=747676 RepID=F4RQC7_MELLP|nr:uncharacterized protein MELLADRAFT_107662 [Melampsora larici-populina 98AG31]EGG05429.1 hypothetical protein MELLADRAFT_107662 [Melampsora larici-populina 98AG31]
MSIPLSAPFSPIVALLNMPRRDGFAKSNLMTTGPRHVNDLRISFGVVYKASPFNSLVSLCIYLMDPSELQALLQATTQQLAAQTQLISQMQTQAASRDQAYDTLLKKLKYVGLQSPPKSKSKAKSKAAKDQPAAASSSRAPPVPLPSNKTTATPRPRVTSKRHSSTSTPKKSPLPAKSTPKSSPAVRSTKKQAGPPITASPKRSPHQVLSGEFPEDYTRTKECFFTFVRIIWDLAAAGSVPVAPDPALLTKFNARFSDPAQITAVADSSNSQDLIPQTEIISLREARAGRVKIGKGIVYVQDFFVRYSLAMLAKLGIRRWAPDLDAAPDSMWNEACRLSAIRIFRMWVAGKAFPNANPYYLCKLLWKHAEAHNFPARYIKMLRKIDAHSDDEIDAQRGIHIVKTPIYRSEAAGVFMRRLDEHMKHSDIIINKRTQRHPRLRPAAPILSTFTRPPRGLPLDFYDSDWWNNTLSQSQRDMIGDCLNVMFLPDPSVSLLGRSHPDEKLRDRKFTEKHWARATKAYDLEHLNLGHDSSDGSESDDEEDGSDAGTVIDLDDTDDEEDKDFEDEEDKEDIDDDEDEEESEEEEEEEETTKRSKGKAKAKAKGNDWAESEEFEKPIGGGKGDYYVDDATMDDDGDEERAQRWDVWKNA